VSAPDDKAGPCSKERVSWCFVVPQRLVWEESVARRAPRVTSTTVCEIAKTGATRKVFMPGRVYNYFIYWFT